MLDETQNDLVIETKEYEDGSSATGAGPLPDLSPEEQKAAEEKPGPLTFEERFDAVLRHLRDVHGIHLPEHLAPKE